MWNLNAIKILRMQNSHPNTTLLTISFFPSASSNMGGFFHLFSFLNQSTNAESKNFWNILHFHGNRLRDETRDF